MYYIQRGIPRLNQCCAQSIRGKAAQVVMLEKQLEVPVVVLRDQDNVDFIGPPDEFSNLRPIIRKRLINETPLQTKLRNVQDETQEWNQNFWATHNKTFIKEKAEYIKIALKGSTKTQLTADEMSHFYKKYLDDNWKTHLLYNKQWYKRNATILLFSFGVNVENILRVFMCNFKNVFRLH